MENQNNKHYCSLCGTRLETSEMKSVSNGYICKQCVFYRWICRTIFYPLMLIVFFLLDWLALSQFRAFLWKINNYNFYDNGANLRVTIISLIAQWGSFIILILIAHSLVKSVSRSLSRKKYKNLGTILEVEETPIVEQEKTITNVREAYIKGEHLSVSTEEKQIIDEYRSAVDNVREEVLMILSLEPTPEKKKKEYKTYSYQEASIILSFRKSSKAIQNKIKDVLNIST